MKILWKQRNFASTIMNMNKPDFLVQVRENTSYKAVQQITYIHLNNTEVTNSKKCKTISTFLRSLLGQ